MTSWPGIPAAENARSVTPNYPATLYASPAGIINPRTGKIVSLQIDDLVESLLLFRKGDLVLVTSQNATAAYETSGGSVVRRLAHLSNTKTTRLSASRKFRSCSDSAAMASVILV